MVPGMVWRVDVDGVYRWTCGLVGVVGIAAVAEGTRPLLALQDFGRWITGSSWHWTETVQTWMSGREIALGSMAAIVAALSTLVVGTALHSRSASTGSRAAGTWLLAWAVGLQTGEGTSQAVWLIVSVGVLVWVRRSDTKITGWLKQVGYLSFVLIGALLAAGGPLLWALGASTSKQQVDAKVS